MDASLNLSCATIIRAYPVPMQVAGLRAIKASHTLGPLSKLGLTC